MTVDIDELWKRRKGRDGEPLALWYQESSGVEPDRISWHDGATHRIFERKAGETAWNEVPPELHVQGLPRDLP